MSEPNINYEVPSDELEDYLWEKLHKIKYNAQLSSLYHQKRERFFELLDKLSKALSIIGGSAIISKLISSDSLPYIAAAITIASTLSLVFSFSERARKHSELSAKFKDVLVKIASSGERKLIEEELNAWAAKICELEISEPPALGLLVVHCQNEIAIAKGQLDMVKEIGTIERLFMHIFDMHPRKQ